MCHIAHPLGVTGGIAVLGVQCACNAFNNIMIIHIHAILAAMLTIGNLIGITAVNGSDLL